MYGYVNINIYMHIYVYIMYLYYFASLLSYCLNTARAPLRRACVVHQECRHSLLLLYYHFTALLLLYCFHTALESRCLLTLQARVFIPVVKQ